MERDNKLGKIVKEHGLISAPHNFTNEVLGKVRGPLPASYKPLIGKAGRIFIFGFIALIIGFAFYQASIEVTEPILKIPDWDVHIPEIGWKIPSVLLAGLIAIFILALSDVGLNRSRG